MFYREERKMFSRKKFQENQKGSKNHEINRTRTIRFWNRR